MTRRARFVAATAVIGALLLYWLVFAAPAGPHSLRDFNPDRMAERELDMWKSYYEHKNVRLFMTLVQMLHEEYGYPWAKAALGSFDLARAAARFAGPNPNIEAVRADIEAAYELARLWVRGPFSPGDVATLEVAWWQARRVPGQNSPEYVGELIALENALLYDVPRERVLEASVLRARAARLRDDGGANADWAAVGALLHQSYQSLKRAVAQ